MRPFDRIKVGDVYRIENYSLLWVVEDTCPKERLIKVTAQVNSRFVSTWKKNTDSLFCETHLVMEGP